MTKYALDAEFVFNSFLGQQGPLERLQSVLVQNAPSWAKDIHIWEGRGKSTPVDTLTPDGLRRAVLDAAGYRGSSYEFLVSKYGPGNERLFGSAEVRGGTNEFLVVVDVDEDPSSRIGGRLLFGNSVSIQVRRAKVDGVAAALWLRAVFLDLCRETSPAWASARQASEYWAKVMTEKPSVRADGRDFSRFLPGLFWINFFGRPYLDLIGSVRISETPAINVENLNGGVYVQIYESPIAWDEPSSKRAEAAALRHLGEELFYSKGEPTRRTRAPEWKL